MGETVSPLLPWIFGVARLVVSLLPSGSFLLFLSYILNEICDLLFSPADFFEVLNQEPHEFVATHLGIISFSSDHRRVTSFLTIL